MQTRMCGVRVHMIGNHQPARVGADTESRGAKFASPVTSKTFLTSSALLGLRNFTARTCSKMAILACLQDTPNGEVDVRDQKRQPLDEVNSCERVHSQGMYTPLQVHSVEVLGYGKGRESLTLTPLPLSDVPALWKTTLIYPYTNSLLMSDLY